MSHIALQMPKAPGTHNTAPALRALICAKAAAGVPLPEIALFTNVTLQTVQRTLKHYENLGYDEDAPRSRRPPKLDDRALCHLNITLESGRRQSLSTLTDIVNTFTTSHVSTDTVQRAITHKLGFGAHIAAKKPYLTPAHRLARLKWGRDHKGWGEEDWNWVIWTDESSVEIGKDSRVPWVWRRPGERFLEKCLAPTFKSGRQSLMVWGCMAYGRLGPLVLMPKDERTGVDYTRLVLAGPLWDFYSDLLEERGLVAVMEDGAPVHRSRAAKDFHTTHKIEVFPHPAQSPDMNPIEHVWHRLKTQINARPVIPKGLDEMWVALQEEWRKIEVEFVNKLVKSMPNHVEALRKARGGPTKY
jgi:transposase